MKKKEYIYKFCFDNNDVLNQFISAYKNLFNEIKEIGCDADGYLVVRCKGSKRAKQYVFREIGKDIYVSPDLKYYVGVEVC